MKNMYVVYLILSTYHAVRLLSMVFGSLVLVFCIWVNFVPDVVRGNSRMFELLGRDVKQGDGIATHVGFQDNGLSRSEQNKSLEVSNGTCGLCRNPLGQGGKQNEAYETIFPEITSEGNIMWTIIGIKIQITSDSDGFLEFFLSETDVKQRNTMNCLKHLLVNPETGKTRYPVTASQQYIAVSAKLPENVTCSQCVLEWRFHTGNQKFNSEEICEACEDQTKLYACSYVAKTSGDTDLSPLTADTAFSSDINKRSTKVCVSIVDGVHDIWCDRNCNHEPPYCPITLCKCTTTSTATSITSTISSSTSISTSPSSTRSSVTSSPSSTRSSVTSSPSSTRSSITTSPSSSWSSITTSPSIGWISVSTNPSYRKSTTTSTTTPFSNSLSISTRTSPSSSSSTTSSYSSTISVSKTPTTYSAHGCISLSANVQDSWCEVNCNYVPPFCPVSLCKCLIILSTTTTTTMPSTTTATPSTTSNTPSTRSTTPSTTTTTPSTTSTTPSTTSTTPSTTTTTPSTTSTTPSTASTTPSTTSTTPSTTTTTPSTTSTTPSTTSTTPSTTSTTPSTTSTTPSTTTTTPSTTSTTPSTTSTTPTTSTTTPSTTTTPSSAGCVSLFPSVPNSWCELNCNHSPPNCPGYLCQCTT